MTFWGIVKVNISIKLFILQAKNEKDGKEAWQKKNGLIQRERPAGRESPQQVDGLTQHMSRRHDTVRHTAALSLENILQAYLALVNNLLILEK